MSEKNPTSKCQFSSSIKTMSIVGVLLLFAVILNYINGSRLQNLPTPAPSSRNRDSHHSASLSSMLTDKYLSRDEFAADSVRDVNFHPGNDAQLIEDESVMNLRISNMLQVLEYEKLKSFLRKFSMKTLRKLKKLIMANPDAGHRYLVKLVERQRTSAGAGTINPYGFGADDNFSDSTTFPLDSKQLIKIATVILEPEFLDLAEQAEDGESHSVETDADANTNANFGDTFPQRPQVSYTKPYFSEDRHQVLNSSIQVQDFRSPKVTKAPTPPSRMKSTEFLVPYFSQASVVHQNFREANPNPNSTSSEVDMGDFRPSFGVPKRGLTPPRPFPTIRAHSPSLNHKNVVQAPRVTQLQTLREKKPKPVVEFLQVVKSPNDIHVIWKNQTSSGEFAVEGQPERNPVSFYISSILAAQNKLTEHVFHEQLPNSNRLQEHQDHQVVYDDGIDSKHDTHRNQWTNSDADYKRDAWPNFDPSEHQDYKDSHRQHWPSSATASGFQVGKEKWNRYGLPATATDTGIQIQSPYDSSYHTRGNNYYQPQPQPQSYDDGEHGGSGSPYISANTGPGTRAPFGQQQQGQYGGYGPAHHYYNVDSTHPFGGYGNGQLTMHVNQVENYPSVVQTQMWDLFSNWINNTKKAFSSMLQGFQNSSTAAQKVLGVALSSLAFLAFGSYISILLLRALAPALFLQNPVSQSGATNLAGLLYGRSLNVGANANAPLASAHSADAVLSELETVVKLGLYKFIESMKVK